MNDVKVTIIIPTYNRANRLIKTVRSILSQTYKNYNIIIVDDCSTDNTEELIDKLNINNIKFMKMEKKSGAQAARNLGIKNADSDWIAFLDSDDEWVAEKLEKQIKILKTYNFNQYVVIHCDCYKQDESTGRKKHWELQYSNGKSIFNELLTHPGPMFQGLLVSKKALVEIGYLDENVQSYQEWDTSIRLSKICEFIHIREPLFIYHLHNGDTISKDQQKDINGYTYILEKYKTEMSSSIYINNYKMLIQKSLDSGLCFSAINGLSAIHERDLITLFKILIIKIRIHPKCIRYILKMLIKKIILFIKTLFLMINIL